MTNETSWPSTRRAWQLIAVLTLAYTIAFLHRIGLSLFVEPLRRDFGLSDTEIGLLTGVCFAIPYTLAAPVAGWLVDTLNRLRVLMLASIAWSAAAGFAVFSYPMLAVGRMLTGVAQSVVQPASTSLIADLLPPERRTTGYGVLVASTAFGTAGAYLAGALAVVLGRQVAPRFGLYDWQATLIVLGFIGLLIPIALLTCAEPARRECDAASADWPATLTFLRHRAWVFITLFGGVTLTYLAPYGQLAFMPSLFVRKYGWTAEELAVAFGLVAAIVGALGSFGAGWLGSWLARRGRRSASWLVCLIGAAGCLVPGAIAPLMPTGRLSLVMFSLSGLFANFSAVAVLQAITEVTPNEMRGRVTALYTAAAGLLAAALGPLIVGALNDHWPGEREALDGSLALTFAACAVTSLVLLGAGLPAFRRLRQRRSDYGLSIQTQS